MTGLVQAAGSTDTAELHHYLLLIPIRRCDHVFREPLRPM